MNSKKKNILIFILLFFITNLIFLPWITGHMATDSYNIYNIGYQEYNKNNSIIDGRFIVAIGTSLMNFLHIPIKAYSAIILEIALSLSCITVVVIVNTIKKWKKPQKLWSEVILIIASYYTVFHFLYIENLYFIECGAMALSILFFVLAAKTIVEKESLWLLKATIFLCVGIMGYQGTISMFFLTLLVLSICKEKNVKEIIVDFIQGIAISLVGIIANQLEIKVIESIYQIKQTRGLNLSVIGNNIIFVINNMMGALKNVGYYLPQYSYWIILGIIEMLMLAKIMKQNKEKQDNKNANIIIEQFAIIIIGIAVGFAVSAINTSGFWSGRIRYSIGALIGFLFIHLWVKANFTEKKNFINILLTICLISYGLMNSINYIFILTEHNKVNTLDKENVMNIQSKVNEYENKNQVKVIQIAVVVSRGNTNRAFYPQVKYKGSAIMSSSIKTQWAIIGCYNYYSTNKLSTYVPTEVERQEFLNTQKDYLCIGDVLYIAAYMY